MKRQVPRSWNLISITKALMRHFSCLEMIAGMLARSLRNAAIDGEPSPSDDEDTQARTSLEVVAAAMRALPEHALQVLQQELRAQHFLKIAERTEGRVVQLRARQKKWTQLAFRGNADFVEGAELATKAVGALDLTAVVEKAIAFLEPKPRGRGQPPAELQRHLAHLTLYACREIIRLHGLNFSEEELEERYRALMRDLFDLRGFKDPGRYAKEALEAKEPRNIRSWEPYFIVDDS